MTEAKTADDYDYDDESYDSRDVRQMLLKSFLVVMFCYTLFCTGMATIGGCVFSDFFRAAGNLEPDEFTRQLKENSAAMFPRGRYLPFVALSILFCFVLGRIAAWLAPFSKMAHVLVVVLLVAATMFVFATGENTPPELQTLAMIMVACGPIALLIGGKLAIAKMSAATEK